MDVCASHLAIAQIPTNSTGYARHIGRIGALAVTLGVGVAVATSLGAGTAWAEDSGSTSASSGSDSSASTSTSDRTRRAGADTAKRPAAAPRQAPRAGAQTGARVSRDSKVTAATSRSARPSVAAAVKPRSTALSARTASSPIRTTTAGRAPDPQTPPDATVVSAPRSTLATAPAPAEADSASAPELSRAATSVEVAEAGAAPAPATAAGDTAPAESPALWALLAWTRRAATENIDTNDTLEPAAVTTNETAGLAATDALENAVVEDTVIKDVLVGGTETVETVAVGAATGDTTVVGDVSIGNGTDATSSVQQTVVVELAPGAEEVQFNLNQLQLPMLGLIYNLTVLEEPSHGTVTIDAGGGVLTYRPDPKYTGEDTFTVGNSTLLGLALSIVQFQLSVTSINQTPWTVPIGYGIAVDGAILGDVMQYSGGGDGPLTVAVTGGPEHGTVQMEPTGTFSYTPPAGFVGIDTFSYTVTDIDGDQAFGTLTIYVNPKPPVAADDVATVQAGGKVVIDVLKNDQYPDGELKINLDGYPAHGTVEYDASTRTFTYIAGAGQSAESDTFSYSIIDSYGQRSVATVTVKIERKTTGAVDDSATAPVGGTVSIDVLSNDQYPGTIVKVNLVTQPRFGTVRWDEGSRTFVYTAGNTIPRDVDTFTYSITDGNGATTTATVSIKVVGKPIGGPVANDDHATTVSTTPVVIDILANDEAPGEKPPSIRIDSPPQSGKAELIGSTLHYTPDPSFIGTVTIGYTITDPSGLQSSATVTVVVTGKEQTIDRHFTAGQGSTLYVPGDQGLLSDPSHQGWTASMAEQAAGGTVALNPDGTFTYTPDAGFVGEDRFVVYISDGKTESKVYVYVSVTEAYAEPEQPEPVVQPVSVGFLSSALALGGGRTTAECSDYYWPELVDPDTVWPTCSLLYTRDDFNQVR